MRKTISILSLVAGVFLMGCVRSTQAQNGAAADPRLEKSYRFQEGGWTYVHLEGTPAEIGFQHGYLLAPEISDGLDAIKLVDTRQTQRDWEFFRKTAREMLWPHIDAEYQQELQGIADGVKAHGVDLDVWDVVALNAFEEVPDYYVPWLNKREKAAKAPKLAAPGNCSAFIATGAYTKDHQIDDYVRIIKEGNNGGYANDWLIGDRKTGEIAYLELGLKNTPLWRTKDGYFVSSNFARDPKLIREETSGFDVNDKSSSANARHVRWEELMKQEKGKIDVQMAEQFLGDHADSFEKNASSAEKPQPNERSLCGHADVSPRGVKEWDWAPFNPGGAVQGKATDSAMTAKMSFVARAGHPCGEDFLATDFLERHPEFSWQKPLLRDMKAGPWTAFEAGEKK